MSEQEVEVPASLLKLEELRLDSLQYWARIRALQDRRNELRDRKMLCVVESQEDCVAMEQSGVYNGLYHVLGGRFSPLDDEVIPPASLKKLEQRVHELGSEEIVLAMNPRIEGDLTAYAVNEVLKDSSVRITRLSYGLPVGGSIGFADRVTLHGALESRKELDLGD